MNSRIIKILEAIRNGTTYEAEPLSRVERILKSFIDGSEYTDIPKSRHEELLLAIKNGGTVDFSPRTRVEEILFAIANGSFGEWLKGKNVYHDGDITGVQMVVKHLSTPIPAGTYRLSALAKTNDVDSEFSVIHFYNDSKSMASIRVLREGRNGEKFTVTEPIKALYCYASSSFLDGEGDSIAFEDIKIEVGDTATPYTPYAFESDLEEAYYLTADKLKGA